MSKPGSSRGQLRCQGHAGRGTAVLRDLPARRGRGRRASTSTRCRTASRCCWRTCCAPRTARTSPPTTSGRSPAGTPTPSPDKEIQFTPARVIMQDFTGVPVRRRPRHHARGDGRPRRRPAEDQPARAGRAGHRPLRDRRRLRHAGGVRAQRRDRVRAQQGALPVPALGPGRLRRLQGRPARHRHRPPGQHRAPGPRRLHPRATTDDGTSSAYPDTCVGTDSHTTMVNGIGVVGWGVGGIEAEAAMLGQPVSMLIPRVVGFKLTGELPEGATATDLVLTITEMLRKHGVVGKFVEFYGDGVSALPLANRATIGNMSPEFGSTIAVFPIDEETTKYLELTGRSEEQLALVEAYAKEQGLWHDPDAPSRATPRSSSSTCDGRAVARRPEAPAGPGLALATPRRPSAARWPTTSTGDRATDEDGYDEAVAESFPASTSPSATTAATAEAPHRHVGRARSDGGRPSNPVPSRSTDGTEFELDHGAVAIAAITSCTNTSNPSVMIGAALLAKNAVEKGLQRKPWVKTTLAPGSKVVSDYYERAGLTPYLDKLGLQPRRLRLHDLHRQLRPAHPRGQRRRQRERPRGRLGAVGQPQLRGPDQPRREDELPRVAAAGRRLRARRLDGRRPVQRPAGPGQGRQRRLHEGHLADRRRGRGGHRRARSPRRCSPTTTPTCSPATSGGSRCRPRRATPSSGTRTRPTSASRRTSTACRTSPTPVEDIEGARVLLKLGDSVTTDHISPAGAIKKDSPGRASTSPSTASSSATSTPTARVAATTR